MDVPSFIKALPLILAAILLIGAYVKLIWGIVQGKEDGINGYSFLIWGGLSYCTNVLAKDPTASIDVAIQQFTWIMCVFQFIIALVSIMKRQCKKITWYEWLALVVTSISMGLWYFYHDKAKLFPLFLVIVADICALIPSIIELRKAEKVGFDLIVPFLIFGVVAALVAVGLEKKNLQSLAYPLFEVCVSFGLAIYGYRRMKSLSLQLQGA